MSLPLLLAEIDATREWVRGRQRAGETVGLIPTMGALHEGHLSLAKAARRDCDAVIASVFVNPTQFAPSEDFNRYPRDLNQDAQRLAAVGVDAVFAPAVETMYPPGAATSIDVGPVARLFEGASRPTHFAGVATVVAKLFTIAPADRAYFGQKDYQQTVVVRRMVADLNLPVEVVIGPTVREPDGLAMSSRNAYLSPDERQRAVALSRGLQAAQRLHAAGERRASTLRECVKNVVEAASGVELQYVAVLRDGTMDEPEVIEGPAVIAVAAKVGATRLIDNVRVES
ncbi:Pantoate-beta-alanine ligase [Botrimarina colliarenosi]|uniref:Pantothenate synthetase n=1 Tax=Botrimarina colliarenosi TaxID=2528001 RepID=A0A5C6ABL9_9BACT|nr:pantoate--beta-alanine ligase [Botrimarina colliarenosi]TWT96698.1 Pantoate-beta-alanine ligase [Botrimarina colliarenosi]